MKRPLAVVVILAAALTLATFAGAAPDATKQEMRIDQKGLYGGTFSLTPPKAGPIKRDWGRHYFIRHGDAVSPGHWVFVGMRGTLVVRSRLKFIDTGSGISFATGTWKVVHGSGQYAGVIGSGRSGLRSSLIRGGPWTGDHAGFLALP